jgi:uncharacterized protein GlcG (DUF336 family)
MGVPVSIAIVGPEGHLIALERMDDAGFVTPETAWAKAYTVAAFRSMSPRFPDGLVIQQWFKERNPQLMVAMAVMSNGRVAASGGAAPVFKGNEMVGCYGWPRRRNYGCSAVNFAFKAWLPGTEFLDAETGRQKSPLRCANAYRDQIPGSEWPEIPAETPYLARSIHESMVIFDV